MFDSIKKYTKVDGPSNDRQSYWVVICIKVHKSVNPFDCLFFFHFRAFTFAYRKLLKIHCEDQINYRMKVIQEEIFVLSASMLIPLLDEIRCQTQLFRKLSDFITELGMKFHGTPRSYFSFCEI